MIACPFINPGTDMLNKDQIRQLKAAAHDLKPVVIIGHNELSPAVHNEIDIALKAHELIKIRVNANDKAHRQTMVEEICQHQAATLIGIIGHIAIIYRKNTDNIKQT